MRLKQVLPLAAALLGSAMPAHATPLPTQVVVVELCVDEQAANRIEERLTTPLESLLVKLPDVVGLRSATAEGATWFELRYSDSAGKNELAAAREALERADLAPGMRILSRSAQLAWPSPDGLFFAKRGCAAARP